MKLLLTILSLLVFSCTTMDLEQQWSTVQIISIHPAWNGSKDVIVVWRDEKRVDHYEYTDTTGLNYFIGLTRPTLIKR